jgi:RNA polymerase sigma-32 factor
MAERADGRLEQAETRFIRRCMHAPYLDREREQALALAWRDRCDQSAFGELILAHMRLVVTAALRMRGYGLPIGDLVQEGTVGLMEAAIRFDPDRQLRFSTYATWWIRAAMQDFVLRNWSIVRSGTTAAQKSLFFNLRRLRQRIADPTRRTMSEAETQRLADALGVAPREVETMEQRLAAADSSLNAPFGETGEDSWQDVLADDRPTPEEIVTEADDTEHRHGLLASALDRLPARERRIIQARQLAEDGATLEELGRELGVSKERVRQLERRAFLRLRKDVLTEAGLEQDRVSFYQADP